MTKEASIEYFNLYHSENISDKERKELYKSFSKISDSVKDVISVPDKEESMNNLNRYINLVNHSEKNDSENDHDRVQEHFFEQCLQHVGGPQGLLKRIEYDSLLERKLNILENEYIKNNTEENRKLFLDGIFEKLNNKKNGRIDKDAPLEQVDVDYAIRSIKNEKLKEEAKEELKSSKRFKFLL